jgi:hypothetical protein
MLADNRSVFVEENSLSACSKANPARRDISAALHGGGETVQHLQPGAAVFGESFQQLAIIRRMVRFEFKTTSSRSPTVREADGLACSSRNVYLNAERKQATVLRRALLAAKIPSVKDTVDVTRR